MSGDLRRVPSALAGLHVLADDSPRWPGGPVEQARAACRGGARVVQLRAKQAADRVVLTWAAEIRALTLTCGALFIVNDRFDLALAAGADGVHLGQEDLPPDRIPESARARLLIGRSTHTLEQAKATTLEPVDYVAFGPLFGTDSKLSDYDARGLDALRQVVQISDPRPVVAIGGITMRNAGDVVAAGAAGIAVISAICGDADPESATRRLVAIIEKGGQ